MLKRRWQYLAAAAMVASGSALVASSALPAVAGPAPSRSPSPPATTNTLKAGSMLVSGEKLVSLEGNYRVNMQSDGNFVVYNSANKPLWNTRTEGQGGYRINLQASDGNLVLYTGSGHALWSADIAGRGGVRLVMQSDGNLVVYNAANQPVWNADSGIEVYGNCVTPSVEPSEIVLACGDGNALLEGLHWTSWTAGSATAVGTFVYNDCTPNCADGHFHRITSDDITLSDPVNGAGGQRVWSKVQESRQPPGYRTGPYHGGPQPLPTKPA